MTKINKNSTNSLPFFENEVSNLSECWTKKKFKYPNRTIKLATMFSGIGAIEFALKRLNLKTDIIFACDNDKFVKKSYFANYEITEDRWYNDVHDINGQNISIQ